MDSRAPRSRSHACIISWARIDPVSNLYATSIQSNVLYYEIKPLKYKTDKHILGKTEVQHLKKM